MNILVVHGPNLNLLGESRKDPVSYADLNARLKDFAGVLGVGLKIVQSNHEGELVDALQAERKWADAVLINPAALTHTSYSLRECLRILEKPAIEVHLEDIRRRETWRRKSVIKDVCEAQVMGKGLLSYLDGLERLATGQYSGVRKGKSKVPAAGKAPLGRGSEAPRSAPAPVEKAALGRREPAAGPAAKPQKTIGRSIPEANPAELLREAAQMPPAPPAQATKSIGRLPVPPQAKEVLQRSGRASGLSRSEVRERIAARLGNRITAGALASWAREQWSNLDRGAPTEMGQRELLDEALQTLALSATPAGQLTDNELVELMARLD